jgi:hypothetical protein
MRLPGPATTSPPTYTDPYLPLAAAAALPCPRPRSHILRSSSTTTSSSRRTDDEPSTRHAHLSLSLSFSLSVFLPPPTRARRIAPRPQLELVSISGQVVRHARAHPGHPRLVDFLISTFPRPSAISNLSRLSSPTHTHTHTHPSCLSVCLSVSSCFVEHHKVCFPPPRGKAPL